MKLLALAALAAVVAVPFGAAPAQAARAGKGFELYSWKEEKGWKYVVLGGTNRKKTLQEVKADPSVVTGVEKITDVLKKLPEGETVSWGHVIEGFEYPPKEDVKKIDEAAKTAKLKLLRPKLDEK
jgi:hypothetical protein